MLLLQLLQITQMRNWGKMVGGFKQNNSNEQVRFQSGMTSQQKFNSIAESVLSKISHQQQPKGCPMHPKISKKCRKCLEIHKNLTAQRQSRQQQSVDQNFPDAIKWNTNFFKTHINEKMQKNIEQSYFYKSKLKLILTIKDLCNSVTPDQISIDAYMPGSNDTPTHFMCYFYRLAEMHPTKQQINIMLKANNVNVRCLILLYLRVYADPTMVYGCLNHSFKDNKLLSVMTIGEYAMRLFDQTQLNHGGFRIPRLPLKIQKQIDLKISKVKQLREKQFQRERSRSRQRKRRFAQQHQAQRNLIKRQNSSQSSSSSQQQSSGQNIKNEPKQALTLKEKIRLLQQKNKANERRKMLLESYKAQKVQNLESEEQQYNQNDEIQKIKMG